MGGLGKTPYFLVIEEAGPRWDDKRSMRDQKGWPEHAAFIDALADERFVILGGPLGNYQKHRAMLILDAPDEGVLRTRLSRPLDARRSPPHYRNLSLGSSSRKTDVRPREWSDPRREGLHLRACHKSNGPVKTLVTGGIAIKDISIRAVPARVFAALTKPAKLNAWFTTGAKVDLRVGGRDADRDRDIPRFGEVAFFKRGVLGLH